MRLASQTCGQESKRRSDVIRGLSFLFVFFFAPRSFSHGTPVFSSPQRQRQNFPNSMQSRTVEEDVQTLNINLFIHSFDLILEMINSALQ